ncbi:MAG: carbohydrate-binding protein [Bacteroidales bacterium]|nr:carbohydrate-binding protein [Bacteroidales bacterium]
MKNKKLTGEFGKKLYLTIFSSVLCIAVNAQTVNLWMTAGSGSQRMQAGTESFGSGAAGSATITVNESSTYQTIDGFGFTLTQASAKVISSMSASAQTTLLNDLFGSNGIAMQVVRVGIGATDLSDWAYSYRDGASFSLAGPDLTYTIPILKKIKAINPNVKVLATPWSAPMWMKTSGSFTGGTLKAENYESYGQYWLDYMNAMRAQGIEIWAITPQNEPLNAFNTPSMTLTKENQLGLINDFIGPKLRGAGYNCKIICYDHNCDNTEYPIYVANNSPYVDGSAFHLYGGDISALTTVKNSTGKNVYLTEQYTGAGGSFSGDLVWHMRNVMIGALNNWAKIALEWNLAADPNHGPYIPGTCSTCLPGVTINGSTATKNVAYYIVAHMSKVIGANAVRIGSSSNNGNLVSTAVKNTDGSKALVVVNTSGSTINFNVSWNGTAFDYSLPGNAVVSFKWSNGSSTGTCGQSYTNLPATIQAENYCNMSGIQTENTSDAGGGQNVGWIDAGDWMAYSVNVPSSGSYIVSYRIASASGGGGLRLENYGGGATYGTISLPSTGGWQTWTTVTQTVNLTAGQQTLAIVATSGGWNINYFSIAGNGGSTGFTQTLQAESYSAMSGIQTETTTDAGGGQNVGWIDAGDWMAYPAVNIPAAGTYTISYRVASQSGGGSLRFETYGGGTQYGTLTVPSTGGWQTWTTISHTVTLPAGSRQFAIAALAGGWNINWFTITQGTLKSAEESQTNAIAIADIGQAAEEFALFGNFPNPFGNTTTISYQLPGDELVKIEVFNATGQKVATLLNEIQEKGLHQIEYNADELKPGVYMLRLSAGVNMAVKQMVLLK